MRILISGASGLIGSALLPALERDGHTLIALTRKRGSQMKNAIEWDPERRELDARQIEGVDAVIHLAGENIGGGRWTEARKELILNSRAVGTTLLCETIASLKHKPRVLVSASAIGYYGDRGSETLTEASSAGTGFLSEVCVAWEDATKAAVSSGVRVVTTRTGIVQTVNGGSLQRMLLPFKLGLGGKFGDGSQFWSWIAIDDVVGAIQFSLVNENLSGPVNLAAPYPVTNAEFTRTLASVLRRPAFAPMPRFLMKVILGEMADSLLFSSAKAVPAKLRQAGYQFHYTELEPALRTLLSR
ncbi:MAG: TIGR01777 family oxidoreductase [candidate division Zixibacteria bacterium]|nr:TIGR01777 family oxidoreductase [candidate division Zixibacteria bacterium]